ncbi:transporter substrate-binding domain-containing protein [Tsukamurella sp. 8F]|uniref:transporter substrate-binding domain-containing protein n=1 Tax=unclassified Tsukamurella TaxID=2633480 RepID=UPI0023B96C92|nr:MULTISPECIES: transporter substrate-binding domain-containing protein [unclassified Tsukamurella]MDF0529535.1 transporter substrate-binding domain-containing protein [Tsukamurella sp. 8J]MDF0585777.1 transporter substrate-binding domain-containing protein [Tsukamurella sp. 8F]
MSARDGAGARRWAAAAIAVGLVCTLSGCVVPAGEPPSDVVTSFAPPPPGNASTVPANAPVPAEVTMCPATPLPSPLPEPGMMPPNTTMAKIAQRGRLIVGVDIGANLLSFRDPLTGTIDGFDVAVARQIAAAIFGDSSRIQFQILSSADRLTALQQGSVDVVVKTMSATCERAKQVSFSATYFLAQQRILTPRSAPVASVGELSGRRVCEVRGTTSVDRVRRAVPSAQVIEVDSWADCLVMLQQGMADATSTDDAILAGLATQDPNLTITGPDLGQDPYAVGVARQNVDLVRFVNAVIFRMTQDGTWMRLYNQWFGSTLGPVWSPPATTWSGG